MLELRTLETTQQQAAVWLWAAMVSMVSMAGGRIPVRCSQKLLGHSARLKIDKSKCGMFQLLWFLFAYCCVQVHVE